MSDEISSIASEDRKRRQGAITFSSWAIQQTIGEQYASTVGQISASYRANEPSENRERLVARLCALEDLKWSFLGQTSKEPQHG